jgi:hypothetical protein
MVANKDDRQQTQTIFEIGEKFNFPSFEIKMGKKQESHIKCVNTIPVNWEKIEIQMRNLSRFLLGFLT